ncbi:MAG: DUF1552 domain-containing protein [Polyangiaceae bacterium]|jgi:uncharacterized protein DUF1552
MSRYLAERRRFLKLVGASALTYPFLRGVPSYAAGDASSEPMYLVLLYTSCGCVRPLWGAYGPPATGTAAAVTPLSSTATAGSPGTFRPTLSAFTQAGVNKVDLTSQVIVLDGLNNAAANGGTHEAGMASLWTGATCPDGQHASNWSIDQAISQALIASGVNTAHPTIPLYAVSACDEQSRDVHTRMLYGPPTGGLSNYVDPITTPSAAMNAYFPTAATTMGPDPKPLIRAQVQAQVNSELNSLAARVCTEDRIQLRSLQSMWNAAVTQVSNAAAAAAACQQPTIGPQPAGDPFGGTNTCGTNDPFLNNISAMSNILAMSLACDLTRVASFQLSQALSPTIHSWLNTTQNPQTQTHHSYSHQGPASYYGLIPGGDYDVADPLYAAAPSTADNLYTPQLCAIDAFYAQQVAAFAYSLSQLQTKTQKNLLDQTVICWGSELDMGAYHNHDDTPFVLIGGKNSGVLKTGQLVRFPLNLQGQYSTPGNRPPLNNRFHNDLLVTLAQIMGVGDMISTFGATSVPGTNFSSSTLTLNQGVITEILAT